MYIYILSVWRKCSERFFSVSCADVFFSVFSFCFLSVSSFRFFPFPALAGGPILAPQSAQEGKLPEARFPKSDNPDFPL